MSVFGRKKCTLVRTFFVLRVMGVFTALATLEAFFEPLAFPSPPSSAAGFAFSAAFFGAIAAPSVVAWPMQKEPR